MRLAFERSDLQFNLGKFIFITERYLIMQDVTELAESRPQTEIEAVTILVNSLDHLTSLQDNL